MDELTQEGGSYDNLMISQDANVIMPYHVVRDIARNQSQRKGGIGSTGRGIGPCYVDKMARCGIRAIDLVNKDSLKKNNLHELSMIRYIALATIKVTHAGVQIIINNYLINIIC